MRLAKALTDSASLRRQIMGHEVVGYVHEVGPGVKSFKKGDYVVCPFTVSWWV